MCYWTLYMAFNTIETLPLGSYITMLPFYNLVKLMVLIFLMNPLTEGASRIYDLHLSKVLKNHNHKLKEIDAFIDELIHSGTDVMKNGLNQAKNTVNKE